MTADYELARELWAKFPYSLSLEQWVTAHSYGYQYVAILDQGQIISSAAVWRFSEKAWDVAAVGTLEPYQRKGYSKQIASFVTAYILESNRLATCATRDGNIAMIATAKSVGFQIIPPEEVWWTYPKLPKF